MFFIFFDELYYRPVVHRAFKMVMLDKMLKDGYFDMSVYVGGSIRKQDIIDRLKSEGSKYSRLYDGSYPKPDTAAQEWDKRLSTSSNAGTEEDVELSQTEAEAIVNWVYRVFSTKEERQEFTKNVFKQTKDFSNIQNDIKFTQNIVYNSAKVDINILSSLSEVNDFIAALPIRGKKIFFRGHANANFRMLPSIMRVESLMWHENDMCQELLINCPDSFEKCKTQLEKLVEMQHYGLPTRLLDITRNPLVALYFACESEKDSYGELVLVSADNQSTVYSLDERASVLANLSVLTYEQQCELYYYAVNDNDVEQEKNASVALRKLAQAVRKDLGVSTVQIYGPELLRNYIVNVIKHNSRIARQDGAFIICGLSQDSIEEFRYTKDGKRIIVLINNKQEILKQLDVFKINHATIFPEIECVAEYIRNKYI